MRWFLVLNALLAFGLASAAARPDPFEKSPPLPEASTLSSLELPAGRWRIEFANGVRERCDLHPDGTAFVVEPRRSAAGKATLRDGAIVIEFADDRVERWTPVGERMVVEHWFPGSLFPSGNRVLGIGRYAR